MKISLHPLFCLVLSYQSTKPSISFSKSLKWHTLMWSGEVRWNGGKHYYEQKEAQIQIFNESKSARKLSASSAGIPCLHFALLCFADIAFCYKSKACGNPASSKFISSIFSNSVCSLCVSATHFGNSHISNFFIFVMLICDQWVTFDAANAIAWRHYKPRPSKTENLFNVVYILNAPPTYCFPSLSLSSGLLIPRDITILKFG